MINVNKRKRTMLMVMLIIALSSVIFISPVAAQINVSIGDAEAYQDATATVEIIAHDVSDLGVFGLSLEYDPNVVMAISAENNPQLPDQWGVTDFSGNNTGYVGIASSQLSPYPSLSGDVVLTTVTLKAVGEPGETSALDITIGKLYKSDGNTTIEAVDDGGLFTVKAIPPITVSIDDASAIKGETTTAQIIAHDVSDLGVFGLSLKYDPNVVMAISAENNPQLPDQWGVTDFSWNNTGYVGIASSQLSPYPSLSGDVVLTTVTLKAVGEPGETSALDITIGKLYKSDGNTTIDAGDDNGTFTIIRDTTEPVITNMKPTGTITDTTPTISASYSDPGPNPSGINTTSVILKLDGVIVSPDEITKSSVRYTPTRALSYATHRVNLNVSDIAGNSASKTWTFTIEEERHVRGGGAAEPRDTDGDGISDIDEMRAGTDLNDPCDPDPECAACLALRPPTPTPPVTPTPTPGITPTAAPTPTPTPAPVPAAIAPRVPWFVILLAIVAAGIIVAVGYMVLKRKP